MFLGEYHTKFTGQGRIVLPKKFRQKVHGSTLVLSRGFEGCIWGFTPEDWELEARRQLEVSANEKEARNLRRYLFSAAEEVELDKQGRFVIPGHLLTYAGLKSEVKLVGAGDRFEIWDPGSWGKIERELTKGEDR